MRTAMVLTMTALALVVPVVGAVGQNPMPGPFQIAKDEALAANSRAESLSAAAQSARGEQERARLALAALTARIAVAEAEVRAGEVRVATIELLRRRQRARLAEKQRDVVRLMAAMQNLARRPTSLALVQPGSINDITHLRAWLAAAMPEMKRRTAAIRLEIARGEQLRQDANFALAALRRTQLTMIDRRDELARLEAQLAGGSAPSPAEAARALALGERARDAMDMIRQIDNQQQVSEGLVSLDGPMPRPEHVMTTPGVLTGLLSRGKERSRRLPAYLLPVVGNVVTGLGEVSEAGVRERGITLSGAPGAQVVAPNRGRVAYAGPFRSYGHIVIIDHGRRWFTLLAGMASLRVRKGDAVTRGQPIGKLGAVQPRVVVELRRAGLPVDFTPLLRKG